MPNFGEKVMHSKLDSVFAAAIVVVAVLVVVVVVVVVVALG